MNAHVGDDVTPVELRILVERAVRPIRAGVARKRRMREELLAHAIAIYDEELAARGDPAAAIVRTKGRFGDASEITRELQRTVPIWDRYVWLFQRFGPNAADRPLRFAFKTLLLVAGAQILLMVPLTAGLLLIRDRPYEQGFLPYMIGIEMLVGSMFASALMYLAGRMARSAFGRDRERSLRSAVGEALASLLLLPALVVLIYGGLLGEPFSHRSPLLLACGLAPLMPIVLLLMARQLAGEMRYEVEWSEVNISE